MPHQSRDKPALWGQQSAEIARDSNGSVAYRAVPGQTPEDTIRRIANSAIESCLYLLRNVGSREAEGCTEMLGLIPRYRSLENTVETVLGF